MAGHRLGGAEDELLGPVAEHGLHGCGLRGVAVRRRGPVGVDVADLTGLDPPVAHGEAHRFLGSGAEEAMRLAMRDGGIEPSQVGYINATGTSTPEDRKSTRL